MTFFDPRCVESPGITNTIPRSCLWLLYTWREIYTGIHWLRCNFQHMFIIRRYQSAFWQGYSQQTTPGLYRWSVAQRPFSSQGERLRTLATRVAHFMQIHVNYTCPRQDRAIVTPPTFLSQVSTTCTLSGARNFNLSGGFSEDWRKEDDHWLNHTIPGVLF